MNRVICHGDIDTSIINGGFVRFPKYLMSDTYKSLPGLDNAKWSTMSLAAKSVFPVVLYFIYASVKHRIAYPSQETICNLSGLGSRNTIKKACDELCRLGIYNRKKHTATSGYQAYGYNINVEIEVHANQNFMLLPKYVIKDGLWSKLGCKPVAQALYWAMRSFEGVASGSQVPVCNASRKVLCERAGISTSSFDAAHTTLVDFGFMRPV